jgi:metallo-beta-lactamase class B
MESKHSRTTNSSRNPFVDPDGYKKFVSDKELAFRTELERQKAAARGPGI